MHSTTTTPNGLVWYHNGDFSGSVRVQVPKVAIESQLHLYSLVEIPFEDIRNFYAQFLRTKLIDFLEGADTDTLLKHLERFVPRS